MKRGEPSDILVYSKCLWPENRLQEVYDNLSQRISEDLADLNPLILCVMNGGLFLTAALLQRMHFLLELDYIHVTRYQGKTESGQVQWIHFPADRIKGRNILIVDDILDIGITLREIKTACDRAGASDIKSVVLALKQHDRRVQGVSADYMGVEVADHYVFGCGMDYKGYYRNLNAIYAIAD